MSESYDDPALSIEQYNALRAALPTATKIRTKLVKKPKPDALSAEQFRHDHVDQDEHDLQAMGIQWFRLTYPQLLIYAVPNAAKRSFALAARMKAEGLTKGIPDVHLAYPCHGKPGLYIETKTVNGTVSPDQAIVHAYLRAKAYEVAVPTTFEQFQTAVIEYLNQ